VEWPGMLGSNENLQPGVAGRSLFYVQDILQSPRRRGGEIVKFPKSPS